MAPSLTQQQKLVHFLNRTSFGPTREELEKLQQSGIYRLSRPTTQPGPNPRFGRRR